MNKFVGLLNSIVASIIGVIAPLKAIILIIVAAVFIDFSLAVYHAFKKGIPITSRKMYQTIPKLLIYISVILIVYYSNIFIFEVPMDLHKIVGGFILLTEFKSIDENINLILGFSLFSQLTDFLSRGKNSTKI
jgi:choline-glycine betaine transporter